MDLMRDNRRHQPRFRTFNVIDDFNREALGIDMAVSVPAGRMSRYLDKLAEIMLIHSKYAWIMKRNVLEICSLIGQSHMVSP
ncbi:MAG: hypothetical protein J6568_04135 [Snodgrassella sp.]|nr:hypothetical protein [Snodgrassella sp.]